MLRDLAIIVLGFSGFLMFDEIRSLQATDIKFYESYLSVHLGKSKTDQYRKGDTVVIAQGSTSACPIIILSNYISKGSISLDSDEYLFRAAYSNRGKKALIKKNKPLSYTRARETVVSRLGKFALTEI